MTLKICLHSLRALATIAALASLSLAQSNPLTVVPPTKLSIKRGQTTTLHLQVKMAPEVHVNSNTPEEDYLIPLKLTWDSQPLVAESVTFPKPVLEKYAFSEKPVSVFTKDFEIQTVFSVHDTASPGIGIALGKLRYQACTDKACFPPKTIEVRVPLEVR